MSLTIEDRDGILIYVLHLDEGSYIETADYREMARIIVDNYLVEYRAAGGNA